jgi:SulP family sulfate permease
LINFKKNEWLSNIGPDIISGIVVALAIIPEAIAFSIIAGVNPMIGLYTTLSMSLIIAFAGGRPGMISAATSAMALVIVSLVKDHGLDYLIAATILTGIMQYVLGSLKIAKLMRFIPRSVMIGFVNALAILIFSAQIPYFVGISTNTYIFVIATLLIVYLFPKITIKIPAPLVAIVVLTAISIIFKFELLTIGDIGHLKSVLPTFSLPNVPFNFETLKIIFPYSVALSIVGLLESMLTATIIDDMTDTESDKNKESKGQGIANFITGFFGGMPGCGMLGQSLINIKSGGRSRLSSLTVGLFLTFSILFLSDIVMRIPMPVLVGIMIMVSISTFDWSSFNYLKKAPKSDSLVMLVTIATVVITHDLSKGVILGVILSALFFASKISTVKIVKLEENNHIRYNVKGELFFASVESFLRHFDFTSGYNIVTVDFSEAHVWDDSAVGAIDKMVMKYKNNGIKVVIENLNPSSKLLVDSIGIHNKEDAKLPIH